MYCVNCGVELADSEKRCPLCKTVVYHPDIKQGEAKPLYPPYENNPVMVNKKGVLLIISVLFGIIALIAMLIDSKITNDVSWSGYAIGGLLLVYVVTVLPTWFRFPNPVIFSAADFVAAGLFLFYINHQTGGKWFLTLALPLPLFACAIVVTMTALLHYVRRGELYIFGGSVIAVGFFTVAVELLVNYTFGIEGLFAWSIYPFGACFVIGMLMIVIAICKPLQNILKKKFFI